MKLALRAVGLRAGAQPGWRSEPMLTLATTRPFPKLGIVALCCFGVAVLVLLGFNRKTARGSLRSATTKSPTQTSFGVRWLRWHPS